jgi:hypothetical protein
MSQAGDMARATLLTAVAAVEGTAHAAAAGARSAKAKRAKANSCSWLLRYYWTTLLLVKALGTHYAMEKAALASPLSHIATLGRALGFAGSVQCVRLGDSAHYGARRRMQQKAMVQLSFFPPVLA